MVSSLWKFALVALVAVYVCAAPQGHLKSKIHPRSLKGVRAGTFTPHELPCKFKIVQDQYFKEEGQESTQLVTFRTLGPYFKVDYDVSDFGFLEEVVVRPDVRIPDPDSDKVYIEEFHGATMFLENTENLLIEEAEGFAVMADELDWFMGEWAYNNKSKGECFGEECQIFYIRDDDDGLDIYLLADMDNYLIGLNVTGEDYLQTNRMYYDFNETTFADFVLNKTFPPCNDSRAYDVPKGKNPCPAFSFPFVSHKTDSPSSWVSLTGVAISLVVLVAAVISVSLLI